jgi:hypothetical protein
VNDAQGLTPSISTMSDTPQNNIDMLFERSQAKSAWEPSKPPKVLGELLDSRHMLPLLLPSNPRLLSARPERLCSSSDTREKRGDDIHSSGRCGSQEAMAWRSQNRRLREVDADMLKWVDGVHSAGRWVRQVEFNDDDSDDNRPLVYSSDEPHSGEDIGLKVPTTFPHATPLTRKFSGRRRSSLGEEETTPIE